MLLLLSIVDLFITIKGVYYGFSEGNLFMAYLIARMGLKLFIPFYLFILFFLLLLIDFNYHKLETKIYKDVIMIMIDISNVLRGFAVGGWVGLFSNHGMINGSV